MRAICLDGELAEGLEADDANRQALVEALQAGYEPPSRQ